MHGHADNTRADDARAGKPSPRDVSLLGSLGVVIPVYNDWESVCLHLRDLAPACARLAERTTIVLVDDGSSDEPPEDLGGSSPCDGVSVRVLRLRRNLGHQRAIAVGLCWCHDAGLFDAVSVMDGDGEDSVDGFTQLVEALRDNGCTRVVFAGRSRRTESLVFRAGYQCYKLLYSTLTGGMIQFGNFSVLPAAAIDRIVVSSEVWNHFAAAVVSSRMRYDVIPIARAHRLAGRSKMNFVSLVVHGLSAIATRSDVVGTRLLVGSFGVAVTAMLGILLTVALKFTTDVAIPGWATSVVGLLALLIAISISTALLLTFVVLIDRKNASFIPIRDYHFFVRAVEGGDDQSAHNPAQRTGTSGH